MHRQKNDVEDAVIHAARENAQGMLDRLIEIANADPASHVSVKAAETIIKLAREQTSKERDPLGMSWS